MKFGHLKVGEEVDRQMGDGGPLMRMVVVKVTDDRIYCDAAKDRPMLNSAEPIEDHWQFDRETGVEEDERLGWGMKFGVTGSYLVSTEKTH